MIARVIDISHYDPQVDWDKEKASGLDGVYIKCSQGVDFADPMCATHAANAKARGIAVGYYHFFMPDIDPIAQANFFSGLLNNLPDSDLIPWLDMETDTAKTPAQFIAAVQDFMTTLTGSIMFYGGTYYFNKYMGKGHPFANIPLCIAQYGDEPAPIMPIGFTIISLWQYTNLGIEAGIPVKVDEDKVLTQDFVFPVST